MAPRIPTPVRLPPSEKLSNLGVKPANTILRKTLFPPLKNQFLQGAFVIYNYNGADEGTRTPIGFPTTPSRFASLAVSYTHLTLPTIYSV